MQPSFIHGQFWSALSFSSIILWAGFFWMNRPVFFWMKTSLLQLSGLLTPQQSFYQWQIRWGQAQHNPGTWGHYKPYTLLWGEIPTSLGAEQDSAMNSRQSWHSWQKSVLYIGRWHYCYTHPQKHFRIFCYNSKCSCQKRTSKQFPNSFDNS